MLKIKDNVDLKELEKYGFKKDFDTPHDTYYYDFVPFKESETYNSYIAISALHRNIILDYVNDKDYTKASEMLYDLIKADLVEKVNGEDNE